MSKKIIIFIVLFSVLMFGGFAKAQNTDTQTLISQIMAQIEMLFQQIAQIQKEESNSPEWCYDFNNNLGIASTNILDIMSLHTALEKEGISYGTDKITEYGPGTISAVAQFQEKYRAEILSRFGLTKGTGYLGKSTREKLNKIYRCKYTENNYSIKDGLYDQEYYNNDYIEDSEDATYYDSSYYDSAVTTIIDCFSDSDCGTSKYMGSAYCNDGNIYQDYVSYTCNNAGTTFSYCTDSVSPKLKQTCNLNQSCSRGACFDADPNSNYTVACFFDTDCPKDLTGLNFCSNGNVYQRVTSYYCVNAGTTSSVCENIISSTLKTVCQDGCSAGACVSNSSCIDSDATNYFNAGVVVANGITYNDYCHPDGNRMTEYKCVNNVKSSEIISCQNGCENGACNPVTEDASITLISPNGGEIWTRGNSYAPQNYKITWSSQNLNPDLQIKIEFIKKSSNLSTGLYTAGTRVGAGEFSFSLGVDIGKSIQLMPSGQYKIKISAVDVATSKTVFATDTSNNYFTIIDPSTAIGKSIEVFSFDSSFLKIGDIYTITWDNNGYDDANYYAKIYLFKSQSPDERVLISPSAGVSIESEFFSWTVPSTINSFDYEMNYEIYAIDINVVNKNNNSVVDGDRSPGSFGIVKYPNSEYCIDSDNGLDYYTYGKVRLKGIAYTEYGDFCNSTTVLKEVACKPTCTNISDPYTCYYEKLFTCPEGYTCKSGACINSSSSLNLISKSLAAIAEKIKELLGF